VADWSFDAHNIRAWKSWIRVSRLYVRSDFSAEEHFRRAFIETFLCGPVVDDQMLSDRGLACLIGTSDKGPKGMLDRHFFWTIFAIGKGIWSTLHDLNKDALPLSLDQSVDFYAWGRRMFISSDRRIGLGPKNMAIGDCLVLLMGGKVPFVLRPRGDVFELVGGCYVHGAMQGEIFYVNKCVEICLV
jgi:hypothetical protein